MTETIDRVAAVYEGLTRELHALGVRDTFGLMSQETVNLISYSAEHGGIAFHTSRHEAVGVMMADGYAWASDELGVAILGRGPGLANAGAAIRTSVNARSRVLVISGDVPAHRDPGPDNKEMATRAYAHAVGLVHFAIRSPDEIGAALGAAANAALDGRPALVTIADDLLNGPLVGDERVQAKAENGSDRSLPSAAVGDVSAAVRLLAESSRPLIIAGRGALVSGARQPLEVLAERAGALLGTTLLAKDLFYGHPYDIGVVGGFVSDAARAILAEVDCVVAFGASLNLHTTHRHTLFPDVPVVQVDNDPSAFNAYFPIQIGLHADASAAALQITALLPEHTASAPFHEPSTLAKLGAPLYRGPDLSNEDGLDPRLLVQRLDDILPRDRLIVSDAGHFMGFVGVYSHVPEAGRFRLTGEFGSIGQGLGASLGAALARPEATTVLFVGDGGLLMTLGDLECVKRCRSHLVIVVMNNRAYRAEVNHLERVNLPHELALIPDVDFARIAEVLGVEAATVRTWEELDTLAPRLASGTMPIVIDCKIRPDIRAPHWRAVR